jgi:hypothetical protein
MHRAKHVAKANPERLYHDAHPVQRRFDISALQRIAAHFLKVAIGKVDTHGGTRQSTDLVAGLNGLAGCFEPYSVAGSDDQYMRHAQALFRCGDRDVSRYIRGAPSVGSMPAIDVQTDRRAVSEK